MDNLEHMERKLHLPVATGLPIDERLERIRVALVNVIDNTDPDSAMKLQSYGRTDLVCFIQSVVDADNRRTN